MKLKIPINRNNYINKNMFNKIKNKQSNIDIDFFHNKLLNNIIEINHFDEGILDIYKFNNKNKNNVISFKTNLRKVNSAIIKSKQSSRTNLSNGKVSIIKRNDFFNQSAIHRNKNDDNYNFFSKSLNNIKNSINSINNSSHFSSIIHLKNKNNKSMKNDNILEKKMKEKIRKIVNIEDVNCCYHKKIKNEENINKNENKIVTYLIEENKSNNPVPRRLSQYEKQKIFIHNLSKYVKEEVKNYFIQCGFSSIKEYFNDWLFYKRNNQDKNKSYLDVNEIYIYLNEKICLNIAKEYVNLIFNNMKFDIKNFKNFFFEENSGKTSFIITKNCLLKKLNSEFENKNNKDNNNTLSPNSSYFLKNTQNNYNIKYELLFKTLKNYRTKLLDKICDCNTSDNKIEYAYNEFYKLIESLNIDKELSDSKIVKKIFLEYQKKNKINIKNFINVLYGNQINNNKEYLERYKTNSLKIINDNKSKNNLLIKQNLQELNKKLNINKNNNISNYKSNSQKQFNSNMNKNTDGSEYNNNNKYIKSKNRIFRKRIEKYKTNSLSPSLEQKKIFNKSESNKYNKNISEKIDVKSKKKCFSFSDRNTKENSINTLINLNREEKKIKKDSKRINLSKKPKKEKIFINKFKSIRIRSSYKMNKDKDKDNKNKINYLNRPHSSYNKIEKFRYKKHNSSILMEKQMTKISKESRINNLNSDIIDLL